MTSKPEPPKRPLNATFAYIQEQRKTFLAANPDAKVTEVTTKLSEQYKNLSDKEKEKYVKAFEKGREDYEKVNKSNLGKESL